ncbi:FtsX-like permease family protein [Gemella haemolysans]|uniref:ABC transporter permease n=1 Tax=Gemella haemolysans TaxID=1379 RepID=UPI0029139053|nr:FtsX-like permease family protein [Gemella haemolysans]MDU3831151.1 FtsX-like permease family protein [Gemella haemolysans]
MSIFNRAYLYIIRKKVRSSILFLIVTLISFFLLSGSVLNTTVNNISKNLYKDVNFGFNIESVDKSNKEIEKDTLKKIEELKGITTKNYIFSKPVNVEEKKVVQENQNITLNDEIKNNSNLVMLNGITASKSNIDFKSEVLKLEKGRHIEENDKNKIMIHEKFAELNHVNLGDKIKLSQEGKILELEIVGVYSGEKTNTFNGLSSDFIENTVYTDYKSSQELSNLIANNKVTSVEYGVDDPTKLDDVIKAVENLGINNLMVSKSNKNYELVTASVESITKITNMIRIGSVVVGVVILSLILMFWVRERTYEIGILLSLGTSKVNLVLQFIVEVLLVTIFGLMIALGIEIATIKYLASNVGNIFSEELPKSIADELMKISVNGIDIVNLVIVMIAIVIISVVVALLPILKMKPKKILTNIN